MIENKTITGGGVFNFMFFLVSFINEIGKEAPFKFIATDQSVQLNIGVLVDRLMTWLGHRTGYSIQTDQWEESRETGKYAGFFFFVLWLTNPTISGIIRPNLSNKSNDGNE